PTTALDVVIQAQILALLRELVDEQEMSLLLISHDLAVVAGMASRIAIMRRGEVVDAGGAAETLRLKRHPYTRQLAEASIHVPARIRTEDKPAPETLLSVRNLSRDYPGSKRFPFGPRQMIRA